MLVVLIGFGISVNAGETTGSCQVEGVLGAYVTAESELRPSSNDNKYIQVIVYAYGVEKGSVECKIKYYSSITNREETVDRLIRFEKDRDGNVKGKVEIYGLLNPSRIISTEIYRADCR